jgi:hypothetical protein
VQWSLRDYGYMSSIYSQFNTERRSSIRSDLINQRIISRVRTSSIFIPLEKEFTIDDEDLKYIHTRATTDNLASLQEILNLDPLQKLSKAQRRILFICRDHYKSLPLMLSKFLMSIDWSKPL